MASLNGQSERNRELFIRLVLEKAELALLFLGRRQRPDGRQVPLDFEAARVCIDTLEMLEEKTHGNLSKEELEFLQATLDDLRLTFVEVVSQQSAKQAEKRSQEPAVSETVSSQTQSPLSKEDRPASDSQQSESRRRFFKSYGP